MRVTIASIKTAVAEHFGVDIETRCNSPVVARPRQAAMYLSTRLTPHSLPVIGKRFDRHHTTVLDARRKIEERSQRDEELHRDLLDITRQLYSEAAL